MWGYMDEPAKGAEKIGKALDVSCLTIYEEDCNDNGKSRLIYHIDVET